MKSKKIFLILITLIFVLLNTTIVFASNSEQEPSILSESAILIDSKTNRILFSKNENQKMYPASTTKIMTAILAIENSNLDDAVTVSYDAIMSIPDGYSIASLQIDEELTVEQLLQLLLVHSANDAANVLAEHVSGSVDSFVSMMNTKCNELELYDTHFTNAYGLHDDDHYTTANDLAKLMQYCIKDETFRKFAGSASCAIPATNKYGPRSYSSTNDLINPNSSNYYPYMTAGKTGFTSKAGNCLVSSAYKNDLELICVVLGGESSVETSSRFSDTKTLYNYGYNNYSIKNVVPKGNLATQIEVKNATKETKNLDLLVGQDINALVKNSENYENLTPEINLNEIINAPIEESEILGSAVYTIDGVSYKVDLVASHQVEKSQTLNIILNVGIAFVVLLILYEFFFARRRKKRK